MEKLTRSSLVFVNQQNELTLFQAVSKGQLIGCDDAIRRCQDLSLNNSNFRTVNMEEGLAYIDPGVDTSQISNRKTDLYDIMAIRLWKKEAPDELKSSKPRCKKCLSESTICNLMLAIITEVGYCKGK